MTANSNQERMLQIELNRTYAIQLGATMARSGSGKESWHTFRYNFAPEKLSKSKGSYYEDEHGNVSVEFAHELASENPHLFSGNQTACKELDYLLIYDTIAQTWTLEKQASQVNLRNVRRARPARQPSLQPASKQPLESHAPNELESDVDLDEALMQEVDRILEEESDVEEEEETDDSPSLARRAAAALAPPRESRLHTTPVSLHSESLAPEATTAAGMSADPLAFHPSTGYDSSTGSSRSSTASSRHGQRPLPLKRKGLFGGTIDDINAEDSADEE